MPVFSNKGKRKRKLLINYKDIHIFIQFEQVFGIASRLFAEQNDPYDPFNQAVKPYGTHQSEGSFQVPIYLFRSVIETCPIGLVCVDIAGRVTFFNQKFLDIWDISPGILSTQKYSQYVASCKTKVKDAEGFCGYIEAAISGDESAGLNAFKLKNGSTIQQAFRSKSTHAISQTDRHTGRIWGYLEADQRSAELVAVPPCVSQEFLTWADSTSQAVFILLNGQFVYANRQAKHLTGYSEQEIVKKQPFQSLTQLAYQAAGKERRYQIANSTGESLWLRASSQQFQLNNHTWTVVTAADITSLVSRENTLSRLLADEVATNQKKQQLSSIVSHQLTNALAYYSVAADLLEMYYEQWDTYQKQRCIRKLRSTSKRVFQCVDRLQGLSHVATDLSSSGLFAYRPTDATLDIMFIDAYKVCWHLTENFKKRYPQYGFVSLNLAASAQVILDQSLLRLILYDLLENAVRYSPAQSLIKLVFRKESTYTIFQVYDLGIGTVESDINKLAQPFYSGSNSGDRAGLGMGLTVAKALAEVLQGKISFQNNYQNGDKKGTVVSVAFPLVRNKSNSSSDYPKQFDHSLELVKKAKRNGSHSLKAARESSIALSP